jgi:hypothetical protein
MSAILKKRRLLAAHAAAAGVVLMLFAAGPAPGELGNPVVTLGPTTVLNGVATVTGTVAGLQPWSVQLSVNGRPVAINAAGQFVAIVNLNGPGRSEVTLTLTDPLTSQTNTISIPLTTNLIGVGGVIPPGVLSGLQQAAVSLLKPAGGFVSSDGGPLAVSGTVGKREQLASLTINGIDALELLQPNGIFTVPIPGTSKEVTMIVIDRQGVSSTTVEPIARGSAGAGAATSVAAKDALGVKIATVRYFTKRIRTTKRLRVLVTVKDRRNLFIRGAVVTIRGAKARQIAGRAALKRTNRKGQVGFVLRLRPGAFGKRVVIVATAKTPSAKTARRTSVRLPRLAAARR